MPKKLPIVYLEWVDSTSQSGNPWYSTDEVVSELKEMEEEAMMCYTSGFVVFETEDIIVVTSHYNESEIGPYLIIPTENIRTRQEVQHSHPRNP